jgi:hypothetical protein
MLKCHHAYRRAARASGLPSLQALLEVREVSAAAQPRERAESTWRETLAQPGACVFAPGHRDRIAPTCMLITARAWARQAQSSTEHVNAGVLAIVALA